MQLGLIVGIAIAIAAVAFALQNNVPVTVTFLVWRFDSSLAMVLLLALAIGAIVMALVTAPGAVKARWTLAKQRKEIEAHRATIDGLQSGAAQGVRPDPERSVERPSTPRVETPL